VHALLQTKHGKITEDSCKRAGLPAALCVEAGVMANTTDADAFEDLSTHAQISDGSSACDAARQSLQRVADQGHAIRVGLLSLIDDVEFDGPGRAVIAMKTRALALAIGRALHTLQDNCAHHGMPNPQHAWFSLSDACTSSSLSPDLDPAAMDCAMVETDAVFAALASTVDMGGVSRQALDLTQVTQTYFPPVGQICAFLASAKTWDGVDRRWNGAVVGAALRAQLIKSITSNDLEPVQVCATSADEIALETPNDPLDVSGGAQSCTKVHVFCLGKDNAGGAKSDGANSTDPPPYDPDSPTPAPTTTDAPSGCAVGGSSSQFGPAGAALLVAAWLYRRRRRRA
jgi:hypothetical protein